MTLILDSVEDKKLGLKRDKKLGYWYFIDKTCKVSSKHGKVYYHRYVYCKHFPNEDISEKVIHHLDVNKNNNNIENLCCTTNKDHMSIHHKLLGHESKEQVACVICHKTILRRHKSTVGCCSYACANKRNKKFHVEKEELERLIKEYPMTELSKKFGVSDKAIAKRCKKLGIPLLGAGYWVKIRHGFK